MFINDISPTRGHKNGDRWAQNYAKMEYDRIKWHDLWSPTTYIEVITDKVYVCMYCKNLNTHWQWTCDRCDALGDIDTDRMRDDSL